MDNLILDNPSPFIADLFANEVKSGPGYWSWDLLDEPVATVVPALPCQLAGLDVHAWHITPQGFTANADSRMRCKDAKRWPVTRAAEQCQAELADGSLVDLTVNDIRGLPIHSAKMLIAACRGHGDLPSLAAASAGAGDGLIYPLEALLGGRLLRFLMRDFGQLERMAARASIRERMAALQCACLDEISFQSMPLADGRSRHQIARYRREDGQITAGL